MQIGFDLYKAITYHVTLNINIICWAKLKKNEIEKTVFHAYNSLVQKARQNKREFIILYGFHYKNSQTNKVL